MGNLTLKKLIPRLIIGFIIFTVFSCYSATVYASEPSLTDIFTYLGFTNVTETTMETFSAGKYNLTLYAEFAGYADENELSYYQVNTSVFHIIFTGPEGGSGYLDPPINKSFRTNYQFGLSLLTPDGSGGTHRYYTETWKNPDGEQHAKVYRNLDAPSMFLIGFENLYGAGDRDYNDMVFSLQLQHYLEVVSPYDTPTGEGWYYNGTNAFASLATGMIDHGNGTRRVCTHWGGDASGTNYASSDPICMDQNKTAIANWKTQYYLTVNSPHGTPGGEGWYDSGSTAYATLDIGVVDYGNGTRRVCTHWGGDASGTNYASSDPITMGGPKIASANWQTEYMVTFDQTGLDSSATGTVVTVDGASKIFGDLPYSFWVDSGGTVTYSYDNVSSTTTGKRFILTGVTGSTSPIIVSNPVAVTGNYKTQYYLTLTTTSGGVTNPSSSGWFDADSNVAVTAIPDTNYIFDYWELDSVDVGSANPYTVSMDTKHTLHAVFTYSPPEYTLTILTSIGGTTTPSPGEYTYTAGDNATVEATPDPCYQFDHWLLDGSDAGSTNPITILMDENHTLKPIFTQITYQLTITSTTGGTTDPTPGTHTYDCGSSVDVTAVPDSCYVFDHWELDGDDVGSANPYTVSMDDDHALHAIFTESPPSLSVSINPLSASVLVGDSVSFTSTVSGGVSPYTYQWYLDGAPVSGATGNSWTFTPTSSGIYYIHLEVTDQCNTTTQSDTARITVTSIPVGGYSISVTKQTAKTPLIGYTLLLAIFVMTLTLIKRKRDPSQYTK